ncbi:unnamed protein product [Lampetra planeri]
MTDPGQHACSVYKQGDAASYQQEMGRGHAGPPPSFSATLDDGAFTGDPSATASATSAAAAAVAAGYTHQREAIIRPQQARKFGLVPGGGSGGSGAGSRLTSGCQEMKGWGVSRSPARSPSGKHRGREKFKRFGKGGRPSSYGTKGSLTIGIAYPQQKSASQPQRIRDAGEGAAQSHEDSDGKGLLLSSPPAFVKRAQHFQQENDTCYGTSADAGLQQQQQLQLPIGQMQQTHHFYRPSSGQNFGVQSCGQSLLNHAADKHFAMKPRTNEGDVLHTHSQEKYLNNVQNQCAASLQQVLASDPSFLLADDAICRYKSNATIHAQKRFSSATLVKPNHNYQQHSRGNSHHLHSQQQAPTNACDSQISLATSPVTCTDSAALESSPAEHDLWHMQRSQTPGVHVATVYVGPPLWKGSTGGSASHPLPQRQSIIELKNPQLTMANGSQAMKTTTARANVNGASQDFASYQEMSFLAMDPHGNEPPEILHHQHMSKYDVLPPYTRPNVHHANSLAGLPLRTDSANQICKQQVFVPPSSTSRKDNKQWAHPTNYGLSKPHNNHKVSDVFKHYSAAVDIASITNQQLPWMLCDEAHPPPSSKNSVSYSLADLPAYPATLELSPGMPAMSWFSSPAPGADDGCPPSPAEFNLKQPPSGYEWRVPTFDGSGGSSNFPDSCASGADIARVLDLQPPYGGGQVGEAGDSSSEWPGAEHPLLKAQGGSAEESEDSAQQKLLSSLSSANLDQLNVLLKCKQCDKQFSTVGACLHHRQFCSTSANVAAVAHRASHPRGDEAEQSMMGAPHCRPHESLQTLHRTNKFGTIANRLSIHESDKDVGAGRLNGLSLDGSSFCSPAPSEIEIEEAKLDSLILETLNCLSYQLDGSDIENSFVEAFADEIMPGKQHVEKQMVVEGLSEMSLPPPVECDSANMQVPSVPKVGASPAQGKDMNKLKIETLKQKRKPKKSGTKQHQSIDQPTRRAGQRDAGSSAESCMEPSGNVSYKWSSPNKHKGYRVSSLHGARHDGQNSEKDYCDTDCANDLKVHRSAGSSVAISKDDRTQPIPVRHSKKHPIKGTNNKKRPPIGVHVNGLLHAPEPAPPRAHAAFKRSESLLKDPATSECSTKKTRESEYDFVSDSEEELFAEKNALHRIKTKRTLALGDNHRSAKDVNQVNQKYSISKNGSESESNVFHSVDDSESDLHSPSKASETSIEQIGVRKCITDSDGNNENGQVSRRCYDSDGTGGRRQKTFPSSVEEASISTLTATEGDVSLRNLRTCFGNEAGAHGAPAQDKGFTPGQGAMQINDAENDESAADCYEASNARTGEKANVPASSRKPSAKDVNCEGTQDGSQVNSCPDTSMWLNKSENDNPSVWAVAKLAPNDETGAKVQESLEALGKDNDVPFIQLENFFTDGVDRDCKLQERDPVHLEHLDRITSEVSVSRSTPYISRLPVSSQHTRDGGTGAGDHSKELSHRQSTVNFDEPHTKETSEVPHDDRWDFDTENILSDLQLPEFDCTLFPEIANEKSLLLAEEHVADRDLDNQREFENFVSFVTDKACMGLSDQVTLTDDQQNDNLPLAFAKLCADSETTHQSIDASASVSVSESDPPAVCSESGDGPLCDFDISATTAAPSRVTPISETGGVNLHSSAAQVDANAEGLPPGMAEALSVSPPSADVAGADPLEMREISAAMRDSCTGGLMDAFENHSDANNFHPDGNEHFFGGNDATGFSIFGEISSLSVAACDGDADSDGAERLHADANQTVSSPNQHFPKYFLNELPVIIVVDDAPDNNQRADSFLQLDGDMNECELALDNAEGSSGQTADSHEVSGGAHDCRGVYFDLPVPEEQSLTCETQHQQQQQQQQQHQLNELTSNGATFAVEMDEASAEIPCNDDEMLSPPPIAQDARSDFSSQSVPVSEEGKQVHACQRITVTQPVQQLEEGATSEGGWHSKSLHSAGHLTSEQPGLNNTRKRQENESALSELFLEAAVEASAGTSESPFAGANMRDGRGAADTSPRASDSPAAIPLGTDGGSWESGDALANAATDCQPRGGVTGASEQRDAAGEAGGEKGRAECCAATLEELENVKGSPGEMYPSGKGTGCRETENKKEPLDARGSDGRLGESPSKPAERYSIASTGNELCSSSDSSSMNKYSDCVSPGAQCESDERDTCQTSGEEPQESPTNVPDNDFLKCLLPAAFCGTASDSRDCEMHGGECNKKGGINMKEDAFDGRDEGNDFSEMILPKFTSCASKSESEKSPINSCEIQSGESGTSEQMFEIYSNPFASTPYSPTSGAAEISAEHIQQSAGCGVQEVFGKGDDSKENPGPDTENCFQVSTSNMDQRDDFKDNDDNDKKTIIETVSKPDLIITHDFYDASCQHSPGSVETIAVIRDSILNGEAATPDYSDVENKFENDSSGIDASISRGANTGKRVHGQKKKKLHTIESGCKSQNEFLHHCGINPGIRIGQSHNRVESHISENNPKVDGLDKSRLDGVKSNSGCILSIVAKSTDVCFIVEDKGAAERSSCKDYDQSIQQGLLLTEDEHCLESQNEARELKDHTGDASAGLPARDDRAVNSAAAAASAASGGNESTCVLPMPRIDAAAGATRRENIQQFDECKISRRKPRGLSDDESNTLRWQSNKKRSAGDAASIKEGSESTEAERAEELVKGRGGIQMNTEEAASHPEHRAATYVKDAALEERDSSGGSGGAPSSASDANRRSSGTSEAADAVATRAEKRTGRAAEHATSPATSPAGWAPSENGTAAGQHVARSAHAGKLPPATPALSCEFCEATFATAISRSRHTVIKHHIRRVPRPGAGDNAEAGIDSGVRMESLALENPTVLINHSENPSVLIKQSTERNDEGTREDEMKGAITSAISMLLCRRPGSATVKQQSISEVDSDGEENSLSGCAPIGRSVSVREAERRDTNLSRVNHSSDFAEKPSRNISPKDTKLRAAKHFDGFSKQRRSEKVNKLKKRHAFKRRISKCAPKREGSKTFTRESEREQSAAKKTSASSDTPLSKNSREFRSTASAAVKSTASVYQSPSITNSEKCNKIESSKLHRERVATHSESIGDVASVGTESPLSYSGVRKQTSQPEVDDDCSEHTIKLVDFQEARGMGCAAVADCANATEVLSGSEKAAKKTEHPCDGKVSANTCVALHKEEGETAATTIVEDARASGATCSDMLPGVVVQRRRSSDPDRDATQGADVDARAARSAAAAEIVDGKETGKAVPAHDRGGGAADSESGQGPAIETGDGDVPLREEGAVTEDAAGANATADANALQTGRCSPSTGDIPAGESEIQDVDKLKDDVSVRETEGGGDESKTPPGDGAKSQGKPHACKACGLDFGTDVELSEHAGSHNLLLPVPTCYMCVQRKFSSLEQLKEHLWSKHTKNKPASWTCGMCLRAFTDVWLYNEHLREHAAQFSEHTGHAQRRSSLAARSERPKENARVSAKKHKHARAKPRPTDAENLKPSAKAEEERRRAKRRKAPAAAAERESDKSEYKQNECFASDLSMFDFPVDDEQSARTHPECNDPSRDCHHCGKQFPKPFKLQRHLVVHSVQKMYLCHCCPYAFNDPSQLKSHLAAVHGLTEELDAKHVTIYDCEQCANVMNIIKKSFVCNTCNYVFCKKEQYDRHVDKHLKGDSNSVKYQGAKRPLLLSGEELPRKRCSPAPHPASARKGGRDKKKRKGSSEREAPAHNKKHKCAAQQGEGDRTERCPAVAKSAGGSGEAVVARGDKVQVKAASADEPIRAKTSCSKASADVGLPASEGPKDDTICQDPPSFHNQEESKKSTGKSAEHPAEVLEKADSSQEATNGKRADNVQVVDKQSKCISNSPAADKGSHEVSHQGKVAPEGSLALTQQASKGVERHTLTNGFKVVKRQGSAGHKPQTSGNHLRLAKSKTVKKLPPLPQMRHNLSKTWIPAKNKSQAPCTAKQQRQTAEAQDSILSQLFGRKLTNFKIPFKKEPVE